MVNIMSKPRILSVNNYHYIRGGAERIFLEQNIALRTAGYELAEFCMAHPQNLPSEWQTFFTSNLEYNPSDSPRTMLRKAAQVVWNRESAKRISRLISTFSPSIAHLHNVYHHISFSILPVLKEHGVPVVMTLHDLKLLCPAYSMFRGGHVCQECSTGSYFNAVRFKCVKGSRLGSLVAAADNFFARTVGIVDRYVNTFVVPSLFYRQLLADSGIPPSKLVYIPNFTTDAIGVVQPSFGDRYLFFGRLSPEKGIDVLLRGASLSGAKLSIAGVGPQQDELKSRASQLGVDCEFLGHLDEARLAQEIQRCRAVVVPSIWYENAPLTVLEALKYGKMVVGSRIGGIVELVDEGKTGFLFDPHNERALADHLTLLRNMEIRELTLAAAKCIESVAAFRIENYILRTTNLYKSLCEA